MWTLASWMPAAPPSSRSVISALNPLDSAHIRYIRISISAQSHASVPPAPAWTRQERVAVIVGPAEHRSELERAEIRLGLLGGRADLVVEFIGLGFFGQLDRGLQVLGLADQVLERLEEAR